ncbi:MAG: WD40/YVTN/BNR-like repeat-containing protein [Candidatus Kapaibacterium sp.]
MIKNLLLTAIALLICTASVAFSEEDSKDKDPMNPGTFSGMKLRLIGPAITSGRIGDFAVNPNNHKEFYVAVASGGVWKTTNGGHNFTPIFDSQRSYSIGCIAMDPNNHNVIWVGSGENNSQRSVSYGDGVYKSVDGGKSWKNMGLKNSEHIGDIIIDPRNSDHVWVAAQGPLWGPGGDRGLYETTDGGKTWNKSLEISENTGVSDIATDPRDPDVMYASSYQRRRHVWTLINGGPESAIYKTEDGGKTWRKLTQGLPGGYVGRIGLAVSPVDPDVVYALIEATEDKGGFFRSTDRGESWSKRYNYKTASAQYYQEIFCDPKNVDVVYSMDTYTKYTDDGGKSWHRLGLSERHVDDHAFWIDPDDTDHLMIGGDGGIYETYNRGKSWRFFENLPVTQYYRIECDNSQPFYFVYGGTQDNNSLAGPSRTNNAHGIMNQDWYFVLGGDGYEPQIDPVDPNIVYGQLQYGFLVRYDKQSGEVTGIQPQPEAGEELRWNWDTPLILSPHDRKRLYFAANKVFRSDDQGNTWRKISGDLSRQIDRNKLAVMGKLWAPEAVAKNASTSLYGNIISLTESPVQEDLLYVGTDDGLVHMTENAGEGWTKYASFPGVPDTTYVSDLLASQHDAGTVYAAFNNHKRADFKPYLFRSTDKGKSWKSIIGNLPENEPVWTIAEDHVNSDLLFVGTEFGVYFTVDGGEKWIKLKGGFPTIAVRDLDIQERESDLAVGTFGRGIYILDDYAPLREISKETLDSEARIFPVRNPLMYTENRSFGRRSLGETFYRAENPDFGATITYYLKEKIKTRKDLRQEEWKKAEEDERTPEYPSWQQLRLEDLEEAPYLIFAFANEQGDVVRRLSAPAAPGLHRITWDLRYSGTSPLSANTKINKHSGMPVMPGKYQVTMYKSVDGKLTKLAGPVWFETEVLKQVTLPAEDHKALVEFQREVQDMQRAVYGTSQYLNNLRKRVDIIRKTLLATAEAPPELIERARNAELELADIDKALSGDPTISERNANQPPAITDRIGIILYSMWYTNSAPTTTNRDSYKVAGAELEDVLSRIRKLLDDQIVPIELAMDRLDAPWTPGRLPEWEMK